jgi:thermostable 8-oxoguanine DNA glycosylase
MQLDFLTCYDNLTSKDSCLVQLEFWDTSLKPLRPVRFPKNHTIEKFFQELDYAVVPEYKTYWRSITPENDSEVFQRWLFAFMSVHTSWQANIRGYEAIKDWWLWINKWEELHKIIDDSRVGMQNNRVRYISKFSHDFWKNPSAYKKTQDESWVSYRDRLQDSILGLGAAKTSFAIELCYPNTAKLTCLDTHMFQAYGLDQTKDARQYRDIEQRWVDMCSMWAIPPYIARCLYWDTKQGYSSSSYWSRVFEK